MKRSSYTPIQTHVSHVGTQQLAICHAPRTLELELLKICSLKATVSTLEKNRQTTMCVASKSSFFPLSAVRFFFIEGNRPSTLDTISAGQGIAHIYEYMIEKRAYYLVPYALQAAMSGHTSLHA